MRDSDFRILHHNVAVRLDAMSLLAGVGSHGLVDNGKVNVWVAALEVLDFFGYRGRLFGSNGGG